MAYVTLRNIGTMTDAQVSDAIIKRLPHNTFVSVATSHTKHFFHGPGEVDCRRIALIRTTVMYTIEALRDFFTHLFFSEDRFREGNADMVINDDRLLEFLLKGKGESEEMELAFISCKKFQIYVTEDYQYADIEVLDSKLKVVADISGQIGRMIINNAAVIV